MKFSGLYLLLCLPILASQYYSPTTNVAWVLLALGGMLFFLLTSFTLLAKIKSLFLRKSIGLALILSLATFQLTRLVSFYLQGESFNERFFFHFTLNSLTEAGTAYLELQSAIAVYLLLLLVLSWKLLDKSLTVYLQNKYQIIPAILLVPVLEPDFSRLANWQANYTLDSRGSIVYEDISWQALGLQQSALDPSIGTVAPGKNLLFIYLESLEQIYLDNSLFPGLTPNLQALQQQGLTFSNMWQTPGTGWTIGGIVSSQCGTPLLFNRGPNGNDALQNGFLSKAVCLGDILAQGGYQQVYMGGASQRFAGKGTFLAEHGYQEVNGKDELTPLLEDASYIHGWGLYDDSLFQLAENKFTELAAKGSPFNLSMLTLDTHHPVGHASKSCSRYQAIDNTILDAVHCSDYLLGNFLDKLRQHPTWDNTVVVLFSDHLAMRNVAQQYYPKDYKRKLLFTILNGGSQGIIERSGTHLDVAPTLLSLLEVKHDRKFLGGHNLLAEPFIPLNVNHFAADRKDALRYLNNNILTKPPTSICQSSSQVRADEHQLKVGEQNVNLTILGEPFDLKVLQSSHGFFALLDKEGRVKLNMTVNLDNLQSELFRFRTETFLLLAKADRLPTMLRSYADNPNEISVLLGNLESDVFRLGGVDTIENLHIENDDCASLFKQASKNGKTNPLAGLLKICSSETPNVSNYLNPENDSIQLSHVAYYGLMYEAELVKTGESRYQVISYAQKDENQNDPNTSFCHASYDGSELIIPSLVYGNQHHAIKMRQIPGENLHFRMVEKLRADSMF